MRSPVPPASIEEDIGNACIDAIEQSKLKMPKLGGRVAKAAAALWRPQLHCTGMIIDGVRELWFLSSCTLAKNASTEVSYIAPRGTVHVHVRCTVVPGMLDGTTVHVSYPRPRARARPRPAKPAKQDGRGPWLGAALRPCCVHPTRSGVFKNLNGTPLHSVAAPPLPGSVRPAGAPGALHWHS